MENINTNCKSCQTLAIKNKIISAILNAKNTNKGVQEYKAVLENDFREFANNEDSLQKEAEALLKLQDIQKQLTLISSNPSLYKKTIVGVGGGFSSGKSEFISSFFQEGKTKLTIGIEPMTAIPTYVIDEGGHHGLFGCTNNGASVNLAEIDPEIQSKMSHQFIQSFGFNLRNIMPFAVLQTKLSYYKNLCFVDTPGYNPSQTADSYTIDDIKTAKEFLDNAEILLWLIGLDANGTISRSDLDFLKALDLSNKKLYIILNKADLKLPSAIEGIMQEVASTLKDEDIQYEGISAYSSRRKKEARYQEISLFDFLKQNNLKSETQKKIIQELHTVKSMYRTAILKNKKEQEAIYDALHSLSLDLYEEGFEDENHPIFQRIAKLKKCFDSSKYEESLKRLDDVIENFKKAIDEVFSNYLQVDFDEVDEKDIELDVDLQIYGVNPQGKEKYQEALNRYNHSEFKEAIALFEEAIDVGDILACSFLGYMYRNGKGVSQDYAKAKELYEMGIKRGDGRAYNNLGVMYYDGKGVPQDYAKAKELFESAIERGNDSAYNNLGDIYYYGKGVSQDYAKAKELYEMAIERGNDSAYNNLGDMYYYGKGVERDKAKAKELYELGASRGDKSCKKALEDKF